MSIVEIANRQIGPGEPVYVIAEISANHGQRFETAVELLEAAHAAGADAVKIQTYTPDTMTLQSDAQQFQIEGTIWEGRRLYDLYREAFMPWEWQPRLKALADEMGIHLFSSAYDESAVEFLEHIAMPAYKIASFELVDLPLIRRVARTGRPVILSTGMATQVEIDEAVTVFRESGGVQLALLKCTSAYPSPLEAMNLRSLIALRERYGTPVGLSDHTQGTTAAVAAVALGASIVEKHFTLSRSIPGPDQQFSLEPAELRALVGAIREAEAALGSAELAPTDAEQASRRLRRSLFVVADLQAGDEFTTENIRSIRPADGLHPRHLEDVLGRQASRDIERGTPLDWSLVAPE